MHKDIFAKVREEKDLFEDGSISLIKGKEHTLTFNQRDTLNRIEFYLNSVFEYGPLDSEGLEKLFFNIVLFPSQVAIKSIDLDVKNFVWLPEEGQDQWPAWFYTREFRMWVKDTWFAKLINETGDDLVHYGSVVHKKVPDNKLSSVSLHKFRNDPTVQWLKKASWIHELHDYTREELDEYPAWKNHDAVTFDEHGKAEVTEAYGFVPRQWLSAKNVLEMNEDTGKDRVRAFFVLAGIDEVDSDGNSTGVILYSQEVSEWPYRDAHWERVKGRWLGRGEVEKQFENQTAYNKITQRQLRGLDWSSRVVLQSSDATVAKNLLSDVRDGDILMKSRDSDGITRVDTTSRASVDFNQAFELWGANTREKSMSFEVSSGESMPSGTPFRLGALLKTAIGGYWDKKREDFGLFLKEVILEFVVPEFSKVANAEHIFSFAGAPDELEAFDKQYANAITRNALMNHMEATGMFPEVPLVEKEMRTMKERQQAEPRRYAKVVADFFKDRKFLFDLELTGEGIDFDKNIESLTNIMTTVMQNPAIIQQPELRRVFFRLLSMLGLNPASLFGGIVFQDAPQAPTTPQTPAPGAPGGKTSVPGVTPKAKAYAV